ncbi:hypothetical protein ASF53_12615 [Methylobacterium sp. Leaf123]|uniref:hypothetical protein n=1 Tax=Methylobacterium sp. Leaf123 TaxID=1736264 RepID=UPI00071300C9|nr:hypothetical protein [Methylobacterium sp. Leaf123]KQQ13040.1 hypothetical protein ASF53_12615 [Methylobacterium sp. Leaf123]
MRWRYGAFATAILSFAAISAVHAASARVPIDTPLPAILRERVASMLRVERPGDAEAALANTKILGDSWREGDTIFLRVEDDCREGLCMTMIARLTSEAIIPELVLNAGPNASMYDSASSLWKSDRPIWSVVFEGTDGSRLIASSRKGRWVVEANGSWQPPAASVIEEPRESPPPVPLEEFRRQLGLEP